MDLPFSVLPQHCAVATGSDAFFGLQKEDVLVSLSEQENGLAVSVTAKATPLKELVLRWNFPLPEGSRILGGAWERGYGDYEWRGLAPERVMPWYFLADLDSRGCWCFGVKVRPHALCWWTADLQGFSLHLDLRCGGEGVVLKGRTLPAATVAFRRYETSAFTAMGLFMRELCEDPLLPPQPVYGSNNWYYAYGKSSREEILGDTDYLASLTTGLENRPYMVIDDGWQVLHGNGFNGGPWREGNGKFPHMETLAGEIRQRGARPGIWVRLLWNRDPAIPESWRSKRDPEYLDPSVPQVLDYIAQDICTLTDWGFELIKHDFSTFDIFGRWGFQMGSEITGSGWRFADETLTGAEVVLKLYETILQAAKNKSLILGCNTMGHLGAGLMHLNRTGDDTSGLRWDRTRKMGGNTLAFTLPQHGAFYAIDADCVGVTGQIPWELNRRWLRLLAESGTPLFTSIKPGILTPEQEPEVRAAYAIASKGTASAIPLDWQSTACPSRWEFSGHEERVRWMPEQGLLLSDL